MMTAAERETALERMRLTSQRFYESASYIGVHPFIEFCGLMNEYIKACQNAHDQGIDFTECNVHSGHALPMGQHNIAYVNEKLQCIYTGRVMMKENRHAS